MEQTEFENTAKSIRLKVYATALSMSSDTDEAEDTAQDVMLKLWSLHKDIDNSEHMERLAVRMAHNIAVDKYRQKHTVRLPEEKDIIDESMPTPERDTENKENEEWLNRKIAALPPTEHLILKLRQVERKSNEEIARMLGIEQSSVVTLLSRARKKILNEINKRTR